MPKNLIIVESPTKAKTISKFLGKDFTVLSSFGHVRDLPKSKIGVDVEHDFEPKYVVPVKAKKVVAELKKAAEKADTVYFATDEDREGEAITWHLADILGVPAEKAKRITFHEITESAVRHALENPRHIDGRLVDAQQARRVLDRLVGYELSPFLWHKVARGLSAGRVQSVVVRLIVEREREIQAFKPQEYWTIEALLKKLVHSTGSGQVDDATAFPARLLKKDGESLDKFAFPDEAATNAVLADLDAATWTITNIERKRIKRAPHAPFTTSTLQQEANNRLGFSAKQTMTLAQQLYEGIELGGEGHVGLITYMRTDSTNLASKFLDEARTYIKEKLGADSLPEEARKYATKSKGAQEAHEAIRPTEAARHPDELRTHLDDRQFKLYDLIWRRAIASQMVDAELATVAVDIDAVATAKPVYTFRANGSTIAKPGFMAVYETDTKEILLPELEEKEKLDAESVTPKQHFTEPLPRYTEASLVKVLEENGIGRPSTYAPTISTVVDRGYVDKDQRKLKPTDLAFLVNDLLVQHFPDVVDSQFTAHMEEKFDDIAEGKIEWVPVIRDFYEPFHKNLEIKEKEVSKKAVTEEATDEKCDVCGKPMIIKFGRFGKFLACTGFPECKHTKPIPGSKDAEAEAQVTDEKCSLCGAPMVIKHGRFGPFLGCSRYPECKNIKAILKKTGVKCNVCKEGDIVERRSKGGRTFYGCSRYPDCKNTFFARPTGELCPKTGDPLVFAKKGLIKCSNKECDYEKETEVE